MVYMGWILFWAKFNAINRNGPIKICLKIKKNIKI